MNAGGGTGDETGAGGATNAGGGTGDETGAGGVTNAGGGGTRDEVAGVDPDQAPGVGASGKTAEGAGAGAEAVDKWAGSFFTTSPSAERGTPATGGA